LVSFGVAFSGAVSPGPLLALAIVEAHRRGFWAGPLLIVGHALLEVVMLFALIWGLQPFLSSSIVTGLLGLVGGGFLLFMAGTIVKEAYETRGEIDFSSSSSFSKTGPVIAGILVSLSNPYWTLWWVTFGAALLAVASKFGLAGLVVFFVGHILADFIWYSLVTLFFSSSKSFVKPQIYQFILFLCGFFLFALAVYFIYFGWRAFLT
jgi:threonine/homoserine/homoserine lactone efflux protein